MLRDEMRWALYTKFEGRHVKNTYTKQRACIKDVRIFEDDDSRRAVHTWHIMFTVQWATAKCRFIRTTEWRADECELIDE